MISTMTTSENFPLTNSSRCGTSPYKSIIQSSYVSPSPTSSMRRNQSIDDNLLRSFSKDYQQFNKGIKDEKEFPSSKEETFSEFELSPGIICNSISVSGGGVVTPEAAETDLTELLDHIELDDIAYDPSKPLKIDPNVFKLDFSNFSNHDRTFSETVKPLDGFNLRASHHLSGGGLITDASQNESLKNDKDSEKNRFCKLSGGGVLSTENVFNFNQLNDSDFRISNFLNPVSPSSPLTFDLTSNEVKNVTDVISQDSESTNPFKNFMKDVLDSENLFPSTNPFNDLSFNTSSLGDITNCSKLSSTSYENVILPQKSFSQCSTRPASPVSKSSSDESSILNPFLINRTSPEPRPIIPQFFINDFHQKSSNPSSFIFAVPVFPIFQHNITNSSTQTNNDVPIEEVKTVEPVYQNISNQLKKFIQRNDHSEYDLQCLKTTVKDLRNSGWYYENVSWQESIVLLKNTEPGTFLIRDSSDPNFLFSLSVQTSRGPTSVRLHYVNGQFRLDAEEKLVPHMPSFNSVVELIDYYIENTVKNKFTNKFKKASKKNGKNKLQKSKEQVWIDSQGNIYSNILLVKPLYKKEHFSSLQHLARLTINRCIKLKMNEDKNKPDFRVTPVYESSPFQDCSFPSNFDNFCPILSIDTLPLPVTLSEYLKDYPYCH